MKQIYPDQNQENMGNLLNVIAVLLVIIWGIFYIGFHAGGLIHILLVIAAAAILIRVINRDEQQF